MEHMTTELQDPKALIGQTILGSYIIEEQVAKGGMAWIYRVRHSLLNQPLALKLLFTHLAEDQIVRAFCERSQDPVSFETPQHRSGYGDLERWKDVGDVSRVDQRA
ncbi:MAG: hypothetical protein H6727_03380 [Myxococcales bacterium]|nr:hypothetical protein [Myxococcales bacterium]